MEQGAKELIREKKETLKGSREREAKNRREQGARGKMLKGAGSADPPNRASLIISSKNEGPIIRINL